MVYWGFNKLVPREYQPFLLHLLCRLDPTRIADVPIEHFSALILKLVIVICDRYSAYKKLARLNLAIILAFCWVHVRRDFLNLARSYPDLKNWGLDWVDEISKLYHLNN